jgi:hypothetical protein
MYTRHYRVVIRSRLAGMRHAKAIARRVSTGDTHLFDYLRWTEPMGQWGASVGGNGKRLAAEGGLWVEYIPMVAPGTGRR